MDAVGDVSHRDLAVRPAGEETLEQPAAHLAMEPADPVDGAAAVDGQVGHVERLRRSAQHRALGAVGRPPQGEQSLQTDAQFVRVAPQVLRHQRGRKTVEAGFDRRVGGKKVPGSRGGEGHLEGDSPVLHVTTRPLQDGERGMALVEMADVGFDPQLAQQPPAADAQDHLLLQAYLGAAPVELAGYAAVGRTVQQVVGVEQVELDPSGIDLPHAQVHRPAGKLERHADPLAVGVAEGHDGELAGIVEGVELDLIRRRSRASAGSSPAARAVPLLPRERRGRWPP